VHNGHPDYFISWQTLISLVCIMAILITLSLGKP
jgi:hypothetical protein